MSVNRFDLEQQIMSCWHVVDDLKDLSEAVLENDLSKDQIANALTGLNELYQIKFDKLFRQFEELVASKDQYGLSRNPRDPVF